MSQSYTASDIEVLSGLEPVRRRPGMYTDTSRPNHLAHEVIDNSVDEALAGHCDEITVTLYTDGSFEVIDNGRGMPVDIHPKEKVSGVELILTRLHAGGKFSDAAYQFSGGLHGVGVSVVNALSTHLECWIRRGGKEYNISFKDGKVASKLEVIGAVGQRNTGTTVRFWPDPKFFDAGKFSVPQLRHVLKAKAVLCPGLRVKFTNEASGEQDEWFFTGDLGAYLNDELGDIERLPAEPITGKRDDDSDSVSYALAWVPGGGAAVAESYVNLIPTVDGGTHVNGLRAGLVSAVREFCEFRNLVPRGVKLTAEDVWDRVSFVLSIKIREPQFAGQMKARLGSRDAAQLVESYAKDAIALWLNQHPEAGERIAQFAIANAQERLKAAQRVQRKRIASGPALPGKLADCTSQDPVHSELFLVEGDSAGGSAKQARDREFQAIMPLRGKILNTWEVDARDIGNSQEVHDISVALGIDAGSADLSDLRYHKVCILADADSDGQHIATLLCALFLRHFRPLVTHGHVHVAMPPLFRIDAGKSVWYALDEAERDEILKRLEAEKARAKPVVTRFKGLGEMNPSQLRETTMDPRTRRLVQLTVSAGDQADQLMDMLLAKKRSGDRREWLEHKGNLAQV
ncbi:MAG TPA: DNA topoisomerase IV subunit B [Steroidobacteraceae bacterium]|nr:DNA topoisomerase IV subunit B [Steroidobacteraceae bacterium]HQX45871.1 DNA topoisomerase IV subunit B [Steroidobacteraceae bacterium]HQX77459.1 DNA topoisomerase IV subunit B [Steroidobacteraceae bacterium]HQZ79344.1 DNA topoisomerase IV subunit B [Steroidobacteraceae bacterium]